MTYLTWPLRLAVVFLLMGATGCGGVKPEVVQADGQVEQPSTFDHGALSDLLTQHVDERGMVDYDGLTKADALDAYLRTLAATDPAQLGEAEALAFWINAYNAYTLKLIADNYPTESIRRLTPVRGLGTSLNVPFVNSPFELEFANVGGTVYSLNNIEHDIIRKEFSEPRIHFALVCAAMSCPPLRREAYTGARLDAQLDEQARVFLHDEQKNQIPADARTIRLSKIFDWFGGDFGKTKADRQAFLAPYFDGEVAQNLRAGAYAIEYIPYDWTLNDQAKASEARR